MKRSIYIGYDHRELPAFLIAAHSMRRRMKTMIPIAALELGTLIGAGLYTRITDYKDGKLYDVLSQAPMSTEFANSRFLVPHLAQTGLALFTDCDVLARCDVNEVFDRANPEHAVTVVKHDHRPTSATKMDGQVQTMYNRKNWSSVCLYNCDHPANRKLTPAFVNSLPGRDLHAFCWLKDDEIGELPVEYNYLVGVTRQRVSPKIVHFTEGTPHMPGYENSAYANEWRAELRDLALHVLRAFGTCPAP